MSSRRILTKFGVIDALQNGKSEKAAILWVPGFLGTMNGVKAEALQKWNHDEFQQTLWRFDYSGIGKSTGHLTFENWMSDAGAVLEAAAESGGPVNIVGSSMGGLISLHLAARQPELVRSLYLCAPAVHFLKDRIALVRQSPGDDIPIPADYLHGSGLESIPKTFLEGVEESWLEEIDFEKLRSQKLPIHVLHPELDDICPLSGSEKLSSLSGCTLEVLPGASHSMSDAAALACWKTSLTQFLARV